MSAHSGSSKKLWGGAFTQSADAALQDFWNSIGFDHILAEYDITGSMAHAGMLGRCGILTADEAKTIIAGLEELLVEARNGTLQFQPEDEDIHMNIERLLHAKIGAVAGKLHTGRSRNDQSAVDMHLYVRHAAIKIARLLRGLIGALFEQAQANTATIMPGYTHLQRAQPVLFAHHLLAYAWMLSRDMTRMRHCLHAVRLSPLGAGAIAGTTFAIDRADTAQALGFAGVYENSMDAVSNRDHIVEMLAANALIAAHLSRFCEEIVLWTSAEFGFVRLSDAYCTGSSMMPQKKNADLAELVRGKTGRVYGHLMSMLTVLKGTPLTYNKDFQEDKECLFDSVNTVQQSLLHLTGMVQTMQARPDKMLKATIEGFLNATDLADYLAHKGLPFRQAHEVVGRMVAHCLEHDLALTDLSLAQMQGFNDLIDADVFEALAIETVVARRTSQGGTSPQAVADQIKAFSAAMDAEDSFWRSAAQ